MSNVGQKERETQNRVVKLFRDRLEYEYGGNLEDQDNTNVDEALLRQNLLARGIDEELVNRAIQQLLTAASLGAGQSLYDANRKVYDLLRYGVKVKRDVGENFETVWLIDWNNPDANHFVVAEEVTVKGEHNKRPDIVLYVNGIALGVIELKRSYVSASEGIRQNIGNQKQHFVRPFFTTVQLLFAGNDVEGLRYGVIETPEKYWLEWKEPGEEPKPARPVPHPDVLQGALPGAHPRLHRLRLRASRRPPATTSSSGSRPLRSASRSREGGIIWHTQGSGKSLTMVWLAKWIQENQTDARVLIITDRTELDEQIEKVFGGVNEKITRTGSGAEMITLLNQSHPWLMCSLVHKFRGSDDDSSRDADADDFIKQLIATIPADFKAKGNLFVFVDEAHRTQSGKMHRAMKQLLPDAMFIGFTGTPLLKADKMTSIETFGSFIHTYKFDEAVRDGVVLDLRYEARNVDQELKGAAQVDKWFDLKTKGLTDLSKARLKKKWGTMQKVVSAKSRAEMIVQDVLMDFEREPRLISGRGNAMLVGDSVYQACKFYELFAQAGFKGKVAIVSSYVPNATAISKEDAGEGDNEELRKYDIYRQMLADYFNEPADKAVLRIEEFEKDVKRRFVEEPGQMRLLIVVDKLLTGFDAPSATYLYIDKTHARPRPVPGDLSRQPPRRRRQDLRLRHRLPRPLQVPRQGRSPTTPPKPSTATPRRTSRVCSRTASSRSARTSTRRWRRSAPSASRSRRRRTRLQYQHYFVVDRSRRRGPDQGQRAEARRALQVRIGARPCLRRARQRHGPGRLHRRRGAGDQGRGRALRGRQERGRGRRRREHRHEAVRGRHARAPGYLHPGRPGRAGRHLRQGSRRSSSSSAAPTPSTRCPTASRRTRRRSPRRSSTTSARPSSTSGR